MLDKRIQFDDRWDRDDGTTVLWFTAPKELLMGKYPEAESMEISVEVPTNNIKPEYAIVEMSPTKYVEEEDGYTDYDWCEIDIPLDEIEELIEMAIGKPNIRENLWVCEHCLMAIESREGNQATLIHYVDEDDNCKCDWCEDDEFDVLYELI